MLKKYILITAAVAAFYGCDDDSSNNSNNTNNTNNSNNTNAVCGDGVVSGDEECDETGTSECTDLGYYGGSLSCGNDCMWVTVDCESYGRCGDGTLNTAFSEQCDDGEENADEPDACRTDCRLPVCGDAIADTGEECDLGAENSDDPDSDCRTDCTLPFCGDGILDEVGGEECDFGELNGSFPNTCRADCTMPFCGDGITDTNYNEQCDTGVTGTADGCSDTCQIETGWSCLTNSIPSVCTTGCGDGLLRGAETTAGHCDDGNLADNDGCNSFCTVENGWICDTSDTEAPSVCFPGCGDGLVVGEELDAGRCDDGNLNPGDGCSATCIVESGWTCTGAPSVCTLQ